MLSILTRYVNTEVREESLSLGILLRYQDGQRFLSRRLNRPSPPPKPSYSSPMTPSGFY